MSSKWVVPPNSWVNAPLLVEICALSGHSFEPGYSGVGSHILCRWCSTPNRACPEEERVAVMLRHKAW